MSINYNTKLKELAKLRFAELLEPAKIKVNGYQTYICPLCGNGRGNTGDGLTTINGIHFKCFVCNFYGDIFNFIAERDNIELNQVFNHVYKLLNIKEEEYKVENLLTSTNNNINKFDSNFKKENILNITNNYDFYISSKYELKNSKKAHAYLLSRGISLEVAIKHNVGYCANWKYPNKDNNIYSERLLFFNTIENYTARRIDNHNNNKFLKVGNSNIFGINLLDNKDALNINIDIFEKYPEEDIFVVEGEIDVLSLFEIGHIAIALGSTSNYKKLVDIIKTKNFKNKLLLALDNDKFGAITTEKLIKEFNEIGFNNYKIVNINGIYKDPNEYLVNNKKNFIDLVKQELTKKNIKDELYEKDDITAIFEKEYLLLSKSKLYKTGFDLLDKNMNGFHAGLYVLGAISSLGKTTFVHQLTEQLILNSLNFSSSQNSLNLSILYFSLEQSKLELVSKSLTRKSYLNNKNVLSSFDIRAGGFKNKEIQEIINYYSKYIEPRYFIISGNFSYTINHIKNYILDYKSKYKTITPIIVIDYLQILQFDLSVNLSGRDAIDYNLTELKKLSLSERVVIIVISSLNRTNYLNSISFESFKESGCIEYSADVVWGLQLQIVSNPELDKKTINEKRRLIEDEKIATPRKLELVCLKNRFGISGYKIPFDYYPNIDLFVENKEEIKKIKNIKNTKPII